MTSDEIALPPGRITHRNRSYPWVVIGAGTGISPWLSGTGGNSAKGSDDRGCLSLFT